MLDFVRKDDGRATPAGPAGPRNLRPDVPPPRTDIGTILLHWSLTIAILVSLVTGLRWSADAEHSVFVQSFQAILPQGELWSWHIISALVVSLCMVAYAIYLTLGRLKRRVSLRKTIVLTLPASPKLRWGAVNVILYWLLFACVVVLFVTGILLYLGHGGLVVDIHYVAALAVAGYIVAHLVSHYMVGGLQQWLRLFRPQKLRHSKGMIAYPAAIAITLGGLAAFGLAATDFATRSDLLVARTDKPPVLDGRLDEAAWQNARPVSVRTQQGTGLGGSGESLVQIRALRDDENVYFAFRWQDPSRSLKRLPLIKRADGWHLLHNRADIADETAYYEDKFSVLFSRSDAFGSGGTTHMGPNPLAGQPGALNRRGLHYTDDGSLGDVWQWKASRGGMLGVVDDMWFGPPTEANEAQIAGTKRYSAGYGADPGTNFYVYNYHGEPPGGYRGPVRVRRLPSDHAATTAKMGRIDLDIDASADAGSQWWMFENETVPYSAAADAAIPVGTVIPGVLIAGEYSGSRADVAGGARWKDGHWVLETARKIRTGNEKDLDLTDGLFVWVAVFDRNQTRHTRHIRPIRLVMDQQVASDRQDSGH